MSLDSPHEHADLLAPVDDDGCCGGGNGRGAGKGRGEGGCCGGQGRGNCENDDAEAGLNAAEAKLPQVTA